PSAQIDRIFALAREYDVDLDLHLDVGDNPAHMDVYRVLELTEQYQRGGRVVVGKMAKLSLLPPSELAALACRLRDAGIAVTVLPATDLYLMGRERDHAVVRGVADATFLSANGLTCSLSSNNILNAATPFGDCSLTRIANLQANVLQIAARAEPRARLEAQSHRLRPRDGAGRPEGRGRARRRALSCGARPKPRRIRDRGAQRLEGPRARLSPDDAAHRGRTRMGHRRTGWSGLARESAHARDVPRIGLLDRHGARRSQCHARAQDPRTGTAAVV